jgi:RNA polymerase sigma-70 factor (ECF subfamily)
VNEVDQPQPGEEHPRAAALRAFVDARYQRVVGAVALITGDRAGAEDAVQTALLKAWHRRDEPVDQLAGWITVVASNEARSSRRRRAAEERALERASRTTTTPTATTGADTVLRDESLQRALAALPRRERQVALLHYVLDLSVADVAASLDVTDGTVKTLLSRARGHLAAAMAGTDDLGRGVA